MGKSELSSFLEALITLKQISKKSSLLKCLKNKNLYVLSVSLSYPTRITGLNGSKEINLDAESVQKKSQLSKVITMLMRKTLYFFKENTNKFQQKKQAIMFSLKRYQQSNKEEDIFVTVVKVVQQRLDSQDTFAQGVDLILILWVITMTFVANVQIQ